MEQRHLTISGMTPEARLGQFVKKLREAKNKEQAEELTKEVVRCQHNLTSIRRLFDPPVDTRGRIKAAIESLEKKKESVRIVEDWMDDLCPTEWTEEEELRKILRKLERVRTIVEDEPVVISKWERLYADAFYFLNRDNHGDE